MSRPKVVILGAGFGGLTAARALDGIAEVTLVDRHNFQTFLPLLYQVSTAGLAADHVAYPIRGALRKTKVKFRMGSPISVDHKNKSVKLDSSEVLGFDYLIVALGSATNDFGIRGVAENALGMKTVNEALNIRSEIMRRFEDLCRFEDDTKFSIAVVGGGPTGVEMAGAIAELKRGPLTSDNADAAKNIDVYLVEAGQRLLPALSPKLSERTKKDLEKLGVKVLTNAAVKEVKPRQIFFADGQKIPAEITVWAAGVKGEPTMKKLSIPEESGRIAVDSTLQVTNYPYIFAIGDIAGAKGADGRFLPMVAPVAMQQARFVAKQIQRLQDSAPLTAFKYVDKGSMATIGRHKAVVEVKGVRIGGVVAWYMWLWLHLFYLLGGRNKIGTMADWTWNYLTFDRGNRHIMDIS
ncbi:MAG: NAD(P)/FAD-dependent oxidoreductase [Candidatus Nanopelagicaceae bacterium]|nr:NAD(P)/FAD-dependent oxidoreductase [Candidatus Nanopelagicaceae bacterium]